MKACIIHPGVKRWLWFVTLWASGVIAVGIVSLILRMWIGQA